MAGQQSQIRIPPETINDALKAMPDPERDAYFERLAQEHPESLDEYAKWATVHNPQVDHPEHTNEAGGHTFGRPAAQAPEAKVDYTDEELDKLARENPEQLQKLIDGEDLTKVEIPEHPMGGWLDNKFGRTARAVTMGAASIPLSIMDKVAEVPGVTGGTDATDAANLALDSLGLGRPHTPGERVASDIISGGAGAVATGGIGTLLEKGGAMTLGKLIGGVAKAPVVGGMAGGGAAGITRENGGGTGAQTAAGLIAGLSPMAAADIVRGLIRGGPAGRTAMLGKIGEYNSVGASPSVAEATGGKKAGALEAFFSRFYGSSGPILEQARNNEAGIGKTITQSADNLAPGMAATPTNTGNKIVQDFEDSFQKDHKTHIDKVYGDFDAAMAANPLPRVGGKTRPHQMAEEAWQKSGQDVTKARQDYTVAQAKLHAALGNKAQQGPNVYHSSQTNLAASAAQQEFDAADQALQSAQNTRAQHLAELRAHQGDKTSYVPMTQTLRFSQEKVTPIKGAPYTSENKLIQPNQKRYASLVRDLLKDTGYNGGNGLPFQAVKELRTRVGDKLTESVINQSIPAKEYRALYANLSADMKASLAKGDPAVTQKFEIASQAAKEHFEQLDLIRKVVEAHGGGEKVFEAAAAGISNGATKLKGVMDALTPEGRRTFSSAMIRHAAQAEKGEGRSLGNFDLQTFFTNYEGWSSEAKDQILGRVGLRDQFETIAKVAHEVKQRIEDQGVAASAKEGRSGLQMLLYPVIAGAGAAAGYGGIHTVAAAVGGATAAVTLSRSMAHAMVSPKFVNWLAKTASIPRSALPVAINQLAQQARRDHDDDLLAVSEELQKSTEEQQ